MRLRRSVLSYPSRVISERLVREFTEQALSPDPDIAAAALIIARVAYPRLEADPYLEQLDALGREASVRISSPGDSAREIPAHVDPALFARVIALNEFLFGDERFVGND